MKDALSYEVKVIARIRRTKIGGQEWRDRADGSPGMEYTPKIEKVVEREVEVYRQTFDTLDVSLLASTLNAPPPRLLLPECTCATGSNAGGLHSPDCATSRYVASL